jgi:hypothetical protein
MDKKCERNTKNPVPIISMITKLGLILLNFSDAFAMSVAVMLRTV